MTGAIKPLSLLVMGRLIAAVAPPSAARAMAVAGVGDIGPFAVSCRTIAMIVERQFDQALPPLRIRWPMTGAIHQSTERTEQHVHQMAHVAP